MDGLVKAWLLLLETVACVRVVNMMLIVNE